MRTYQEARSAYARMKGDFAARGVHLDAVQSFMPKGYKANFALAMDAQPQLAATLPNSSVPWALTNFIDPDVIRIVFAPTTVEKVLGAVQKGNWLMDTTMFTVVEHTGEVSSYDDYSNNGVVGVNTNYPSRQNYLFQTIKNYGEREAERAGLAKLNWVAEIDASAADILNRYMNLSGLFGIAGLQNYGLQNDPNLSASLTPAIKAYGGVKWVNNGVIVATANEIYADIQSLYIQLVNQGGGNIDQDTPMVLVGSPQSLAALTATNSFNVNVEDLLKKNFPNIKIVMVPQYGAVSTSNPNGVAAGNMIQLIATEVGGQKIGYMAYSEKMRTHPLIKDLSAFKQKVSAGTWGTILRLPFGFAGMVGV